MLWLSELFCSQVATLLIPAINSLIPTIGHMRLHGRFCCTPAHHNSRQYLLAACMRTISILSDEVMRKSWVAGKIYSSTVHIEVQICMGNIETICCLCVNRIGAVPKICLDPVRVPVVFSKLVVHFITVHFKLPPRLAIFNSQDAL